MSSVEAITKLVYRYCELFDSGDFDGFAKQFEHGSMGGREIGSASLRQWIDDNIILYDGSPCTRHLTTNLVVDVDEDAGTAAARSYVTLLHAAPGFPMTIVGCAVYHDRFERVDGAWRWAERKVVDQLEGDPSRHVRRPA
jgi:3-phenylpropionate/cinnamic acid dioxygenase small subunit